MFSFITAYENRRISNKVNEIENQEEKNVSQSTLVSSVINC